MRHYLPAVCLSSFLPIYKNISPAFKESAKKFNLLHALNGPISFHPEGLHNFNTELKDTPIPSLRVVAVKLVNNTGHMINIKKGLRVCLSQSPENSLEIMPPVLSKKQATSVYFLYNLLHQRLPSKLSPASINTPAQPDLDELPSFHQPANNVFFANTQELDVITEIKEANLINKTVSPGQTISGLILLLTTSAAPLQFFLNV